MNLFPFQVARARPQFRKPRKPRKAAAVVVNTAVAQWTLAAACLWAWGAHAHEPASQTAEVAAAQAPQQSAFYRFQLGRVPVTVLSDGTVPQDLHALLQGVSASEIDAILARAFLRNPVEASINAYLLEVEGRLALVDTGAGAMFGPGAGGKLLQSLQEAGYSAEQITDVLLTHVHTDHSGGLVGEQGQMLFPNATVHVGQADVDFFLAPGHQNGVSGYDAAYFAQATHSLTPYLRAGRIQGFRSAGEVLPGVRAIPTPGHTPGHAFYALESQGQTLEFIGDVLHVQAVQMGRTDITIVYDVEQPAAQSQREAQFLRLSQNRHMVAGAHLPFPGLGYVRQEVRGYSYVPADYRYRD